MFNTAHLIEAALLLLAAYLLGCVLGYGIRRLLHAARGTRQVKVVALPVVAEPINELRRRRSYAARLAATVDDPVPQLQKPKPAKRLPADPKPNAINAPRDGMADNLNRIKGIGPKIEASLNGLGVYHFDQIAQWNKANIDWVDGQLAFKGRIRRERWVEQATELAKVKTEA